MKKLLLSSIIFALALSLVMVSSILAEFEVNAEKVKVEETGGSPEALPDLIVYKGYTSKDHLSFEPPPASDFTIGVDELNCNVFIYVPGSAPSEFVVTYILILKRLDAPGFEVFRGDLTVTNGAKWRLTFYWTPCPDLPGTWEMIPIVKSSTGSHIPYNPKARHTFNIHY